ncbi:MAG: hypothetical protein IKS49_06430 [Actinomycetaceae bacterium]|nr:hypothetical protein [Actinomycetaceae bacterium]
MNKQLVATTGRSFDDWFDILDNAGAESWPHWKIKRYLGGKRKNDEWWASAVAEAYERARGSNPAHSTYSAKATKTVAAGLAEVWGLIDNEDERRAWLDIELEERSRQAQSALYSELADGSKVTISLRENPRATGSKNSTLVTIRHSGLANEASLDETKAFWRSALATLAATIDEAKL